MRSSATSSTTSCFRSSTPMKGITSFHPRSSGGRHRPAPLGQRDPLVGSQEESSPCSTAMKDSRREEGVSPRYLWLGPPRWRDKPLALSPRAGFSPQRQPRRSPRRMTLGSPQSAPPPSPFGASRRRPRRQAPPKPARAGRPRRHRQAVKRDRTVQAAQRMRPLPVGRQKVQEVSWHVMAHHPGPTHGSAFA